MSEESSVSIDLHITEKQLSIYKTLTLTLTGISTLAFVTCIWICWVCENWERLHRERQLRGHKPTIELAEMGQQSMIFTCRA